MSKDITKKNISVFVRSVALGLAEERKTLARKIRLVKKFKAKKLPFRFKISFESCWKNYGEKNTSFLGNDNEPYKNVLEKANKHFMQVNGRSDVQAKEITYLCLEEFEFMIYCNW